MGMRTLKILVVEDNEANMEVSLQMFRREGHEVVGAADGLLALQILASGGFDIMFLDMQIPEFDGPTVTAILRACELGRNVQVDIDTELEERLRHYHYGCHLPVIALTAHTDDEDREECLAAGMDDFLFKPIDQRMVKKYLFKYAGVIFSSESGDHKEIGSEHQAFASLFEYASFNLQKAYALSEEQVATLLEATIRNIKKEFAVLQQALGDGDWEVVQKKGHSLKGVLLTLRLNDEAVHAAFLQKNAMGGNRAELEGQVSQLQDLLKEFLQ